MGAVGDAQDKTGLKVPPKPQVVGKNPENPPDISKIEVETGRLYTVTNTRGGAVNPSGRPGRAGDAREQAEAQSRARRICITGAAAGGSGERRCGRTAVVAVGLRRCSQPSPAALGESSADTMATRHSVAVNHRQSVHQNAMGGKPEIKEPLPEGFEKVSGDGEAALHFQGLGLASA